MASLEQALMVGLAPELIEMFIPNAVAGLLTENDIRLAQPLMTTAMKDQALNYITRRATEALFTYLDILDTDFGKMIAIDRIDFKQHDKLTAEILIRLFSTKDLAALERIVQDYFIAVDCPLVVVPGSLKSLDVFMTRLGIVQSDDVMVVSSIRAFLASTVLN
jgi:hypothetical protein